MTLGEKVEEKRRISILNYENYTCGDEIGSGETEGGDVFGGGAGGGRRSSAGGGDI